MNQRRAALFALLFAAAALHEVGAQTLRDALRARREQQQPVARDAEAPPGDGLDAGEGPAGKIVLPRGARLERDVAYGNDPAQRLDVYVPENPARAPILLMVHGGAWMLGDKANTGVVASKVAYWLPKGYIVASMNYRMARPPEHGPRGVILRGESPECGRTGVRCRCHRYFARPTPVDGLGREAARWGASRRFARFA